MFASQDPEYDNVGDDAGQERQHRLRRDAGGRQLRPSATRCTRRSSGLAELTKAAPGAAQRRPAAPLLERDAGIYAFSRLDRERAARVRRRAQQRRRRRRPRRSRPRWRRRASTGSTASGAGVAHAATPTGSIDRHGAAALGRRLRGREDAARERRGALGGGRHAGARREGRDRMEVTADVGGDSFYEVTFYAQGRRRRLAGHRHRRQRALPRLPRRLGRASPARAMQYKAVVLDNAGTRAARARRAARAVAKPAITLEAPNEGQRVRGTVTVRATTTPEHSNYIGALRALGQRRRRSRRSSTDDSSPVYTAFDDTSSLADGGDRDLPRRPHLRAREDGRRARPAGVTVVQTPVTEAVIHYNRPTARLRRRGGCTCSATASPPGRRRPRGRTPTPFEGTDGFGALHEIGIADDTKRVGFIVHGTAAGGNPDMKDPAGRPTASSSRSPRRRSGCGRAT